MSKLDFHLVSEDKGFKVFQAMEAGKMKALEDGTVPAKKYSPYLPKNAAEFDADEYFSGYELDSVKVSREAGIIVRVVRGKDDPFVEVEPDVTRLEPKGGVSK